MIFGRGCRKPPTSKKQRTCCNPTPALQRAVRLPAALLAWRRVLHEKTGQVAHHKHCDPPKEVRRDANYGQNRNGLPQRPLNQGVRDVLACPPTNKQCEHRNYQKCTDRPFIPCDLPFISTSYSLWWGTCHLPA